MIKDLVEDIPIILPNTEISKVIGLMKEKNYYEVFLEEDGKVACVNAREILRVKDLFTKASTIKFYVPTLSLEDTISKAANLMGEYRLRSLPVKEGKKIIGMITAFKLCEKVKANYPIKGIMTPHPITLDLRDKVSKAKSIMLRRKIDHLPITEEGKLKGILTSSLLLYYLLPSQKISGIADEKVIRLDYPIKRISLEDPNTCNVHDSIDKVVKEILSKRVSYSIVTLWDEIQGIVTLRDIISLLEEKKSKNLKSYIIGLPSDPFESEVVKIKFDRAINFFSRIFPNLLEARALIKPFKGKGYEVAISLSTTSNIYNFSERGYELSYIFDKILAKIKKLSIKEKRDRKSNRRKI